MLNFCPVTQLKMDWGGATTSTLGCLKIKVEPESEWPAERQTLPVDLDIKTEPEFRIEDRIESAVEVKLENDTMEREDMKKNIVKSELENDTMEREDVDINSAETSESEDDTMELGDVKNNVVNSELENGNMELEDVQAGLQVAITDVFTMRVNSGLTSSGDSDGRQGFKKSIKRTTKDNVRLHMKINEGVKLFTCKICNYRTWKKENLKVHKTTHLAKKSHGGRQKTTPKKSDGACRVPQPKEKHMRTEERIKERSFKCLECNYRASNNGFLRSHQRKHTGEKPFICHICDYRTSWKANLTKHMKIHLRDELFDHRENQASNNSGMGKTYTETKVEKTNDEDAPDSLYICETCGYGTIWKRELKKHLATHTVISLICDECGYQASQEADLNSHKITHQLLERTPAKRNKCDDCDYIGVHWTDLRAHKRVHLGEKPFVCNLCGHRTRFKGNVTKHMKTHHLEESPSNDPDRTHFEDKVNLKQAERKYGNQPAHDKVGRIMESARENTDTDHPAGTGAIHNQLCSVCFRKPKVFKFCCKNCRSFGSYWQWKRSKPPDCLGHTTAGENVYCPGCRWSKYKIASLAWEEKHGAAETETSSRQSCSVCFRYSPQVFKSRCKACMLFWSYWQKASKPPDCPGHTREGDDADCPGCRWGRYKRVLLSLESEENKNMNAQRVEGQDLDDRTGTEPERMGNMVGNGQGMIECKKEPNEPDLVQLHSATS